MEPKNHQQLVLLVTRCSSGHPCTAYHDSSPGVCGDLVSALQPSTSSDDSEMALRAEASWGTGLREYMASCPLCLILANASKLQDSVYNSSFKNNPFTTKEAIFVTAYCICILLQGFTRVVSVPRDGACRTGRNGCAEQPQWGCELQLNCVHLINLPAVAL